MKNCYYQKLENPPGLAVLDLVDYYGEGLMITRINVPTSHRGKGIGSRLLREALADADAEGITLWLEILAYGGLTNDQLRSWYERHGFRGSSILKRNPHKEN